MAARAFGQRGTIVHGMCVCGSMAQLGVQRLNTLQESQNSCYQFEVAFKGPVVIPSSVEVRALQSVTEGEDEKIDGTTVYLTAQELTNAKINIVARLHLQ
jgi:acyl dehydratase